MYKLTVAILITVVSVSAVLVPATTTNPASDTETELQELYAQNWGVSPDMVLPNDFVPSRLVLQELYAQNWGVSPDMDIVANIPSVETQSFDYTRDRDQYWQQTQHSRVKDCSAFTSESMAAREQYELSIVGLVPGWSSSQLQLSSQSDTSCITS